MLLRDELEIVFSHAIREYPDECCGIITKDKAGKYYVHKCKNIQNELHEQDPEKFPRDARTEYYLDPKKLIKIIQNSERKEHKISYFYHSHPGHDAYFSAKDKSKALMWDEPAYPDSEYLVISLYDRKIKEGISYKWDGKDKKFKQSKLFFINEELFK